jgi:hypothetical protein
MQLSDSLFFALRTFKDTFVLTYGARTGVSILLRAVQLLRGGKYGKIFSLHDLASEKKVIGISFRTRLFAIQSRNKQALSTEHTRVIA